MKLQNGQFVIGSIKRSYGYLMTTPVQINVFGVYWEGKVYSVRIIKDLSQYYKQIPQNYIMKCIEFKGFVYKLIEEPNIEIISAWITKLFPVLQKIPEEWKENAEIGEKHRLHFVIELI